MCEGNSPKGRLQLDQMDLQFRRRKVFGVEKKDGITDVSGKKEGIKVLGVAWTQEADVFTFRINNTQNVIYTHRGLLSKIASMFDPLGLAAPATIKGKI